MVFTSCAQECGRGVAIGRDCMFVHYHSHKLSREKTFANFTFLWQSTKVLSAFSVTCASI